MRAVIWARGGSGKDIGRDGWTVTQQAWGSGTASCANEGMVGMLLEGWGLGTGCPACCYPGFGGDPPASGFWPSTNLRARPSWQGDIFRVRGLPLLFGNGHSEDQPHDGCSRLGGAQT